MSKSKKKPSVRKGLEAKLKHFRDNPLAKLNISGSLFADRLGELLDSLVARFDDTGVKASDDLTVALDKFVGSLMALSVVDMFGNTLLCDDYFVLTHYSETRDTCFKVTSRWPAFIDSVGIDLSTVNLHCDFEESDVRNGLPTSNFLVVSAQGYQFDDYETLLLPSKEGPTIVSLRLLHTCGVKICKPASLLEMDDVK